MKSPPRVRVASYNVHACVGTDGVFQPERVAEVIRQMRPDIVGLQEVDGGYWYRQRAHQLKQLAELTDMQPFEGPTLVRGPEVYGNAILTRFPLANVRHVDLSVPGFERRGALDADAIVQGTPLRLVVTHFGLRARERRQQAATLVRCLKEREASVLVLLGDFNDWWAGRTLGAVRHCLGPTKTFRSYPSWLPLFALDRIWVQPRACLRHIQVHHSRTALLASDHLPIWADIMLGT